MCNHVDGECENDHNKHYLAHFGCCLCGIWLNGAWYPNADLHLLAISGARIPIPGSNKPIKGLTAEMSAV